MIRLRAETPSTSPPFGTPPSGTPPFLPIPAPTSSLPLMLPSTDHRTDRTEICLPHQKRLCIIVGPRYEVGESSSAAAARPIGGFRADYGFIATLDREIRRDPERDVGYGITDTWDETLERLLGAPATDDTELGRRITEFATRVRQDIDKIYVRLDDAQRWFMDASDLARSEVTTSRTTVLAQQSEIAALRAAYRTRQAQLVETLRLVSSLQTQPTKYYGDLRKMAPKRATRSIPTTETTTTTTVTNAQLKALIEPTSVASQALAARTVKPDRSMNGDDEP
ncbi:hypothetical protein Tco_1439481 [Tanacetum coccineum]